MVTNVVGGWRPRRFERQFYRRLGGRGCFSATAHRHRPLTARLLFLDAAVVTQKRKAEVPPFRSPPTDTKKSRTKGSVDTGWNNQLKSIFPTSLPLQRPRKG